MGVKKAMNMALLASENSKERIYTLGPLVHNNDAVNMLKNNDVYPVEKMDDIHDKTVFIRAHGVPPEDEEMLRKGNNTIINATCPYVVRVQEITKQYAQDNYTIIIVGDHGHAEVDGLLGYCRDKRYVVADIEEARALPELKDVCVIAQTTQSNELFLAVVSEFEKRFKNVVVKNTICGATSTRQAEALELAEQVDCMIVVGGRHSANTKRLEDICLETGTPTTLIENASQLDKEALKKCDHIGVTAGASTPSWVIDEVVKELESIETSPVPAFVSTLIKLFNLSIDTSFFLGIGAVSLYYSIAFFLGVDAFSDIRLPLLIYLFINSVHFINSFYEERSRKKLDEPDGFFSVQKFGFSLALIYLFVSLILAARLHWLIFMIHLLLCTLGMLYSKIFFPKHIAEKIGFKSLKDVPASRDIFQSIAWAIIMVGYPVIFNDIDIARPKIWIASFFVGCIVFARSIVYDIKDIRLDKMIGRETLPVLLGDKKAKICLFTLVGILMVGLLYIKAAYFHYIKINIFLLSLAYMVAYLYLFHKKIIYKGYLLNLIIDGQFIFAGIVTYLFYA